LSDLPCSSQSSRVKSLNVDPEGKPLAPPCA